MPAISPIISDGPGKFIIPHVSGELVRAASASISMTCFLGQGMLAPALQMAGKPVPTLQGAVGSQKIVTVNSKMSISHLVTPVNRLYNEYGGIDCIITLLSKPSSNMLVFDYDSTNLQPFLQPPLTAEEMARAVIRPDYVVNSIAWYHTSKGGMVTPSDVASRIKTGKAFHQYRMTVSDAKGGKSWADWSILNGSQFGLVLDDGFMAKAAYPVVIQPSGDTFGYTTHGGSIDNYSANYMFGSRLLCPNGMAGELEAPEGYRFFQLKQGYVDIGGGKGRHIGSHIIGGVTNENGDCNCYAWDYERGELVHFMDNVFHMAYRNIGQLSLEVQGLKV